MLDCLTALAHGPRILIETFLLGFQHVLMFQRVMRRVARSRSDACSCSCASAIRRSGAVYPISVGADAGINSVLELARTALSP
jgi:hypothetical protein